MGSASRYWRLVRIDATGKRRVDDIEVAKAFFQRQFGNLAGQLDLPDTSIQQHLLKLLREEATANSSDRQSANYCLRCFISYQIEQVCVRLETKFGARHGFTRYDLFPFVLDDEIVQTPTRERSQYRSLATQILETFDPTRAGLSTWVLRQVRHHRELNIFLREHAVYLMSDWAMLNDTSPEQLQRILSEFYTLTVAEVEQACHLLQGYHEVYREDRLQLRQAGKLKGKEECLPPTLEQLDRMGSYLRTQANLTLSSESLMGRLQGLAAQLRRYRIHVRSGKLVAESLDQPAIHSLAMEVQIPEQDAEADEQNEFLAVFREQLLNSLDRVLEDVTGDRFAYLQRKSQQTAQQFLTALELFHCRGQSMGEIASQVGLQAQYQVTRLMKLKEFRASVRQKLIQTLGDRILDIAKTYTHPTRVQEIDHQIEAALDERVSTLMQQAEAEAAVAKNQPLGSLFARRLCRYLDTRSITHAKSNL